MGRIPKAVVAYVSGSGTVLSLAEVWKAGEEIDLWMMSPNLCVLSEKAARLLRKSRQNTQH